MIFGEVADQADSWCFENSLLLSSELRELSDWLGAVGAGAIPAVGTEFEGPYRPMAFTEDGLDFSLSERSGKTVTLEVSFWKIRRYPFPNPATRTESYSLTMSTAELDRAVVQWDEEPAAVLNGTVRER
jgi:hypothetical protein